MNKTQWMFLLLFKFELQVLTKLKKQLSINKIKETMARFNVGFVIDEKISETGILICVSNLNLLQWIWGCQICKERSNMHNTFCFVRFYIRLVYKTVGSIMTVALQKTTFLLFLILFIFIKINFYIFICFCYYLFHFLLSICFMS